MCSLRRDKMYTNSQIVCRKNDWNSREQTRSVNLSGWFSIWLIRFTFISCCQAIFHISTVSDNVFMQGNSCEYLPSSCFTLVYFTSVQALFSKTFAKHAQQSNEKKRIEIRAIYALIRASIWMAAPDKNILIQHQHQHGCMWMWIFSKCTL